MDFGCEIDPNAPVTLTEKVALGALILFALACIAACFGVFT